VKKIGSDIAATTMKNAKNGLFSIMALKHNKRQSIPIVSEILPSQRHSIAGNGAASAEKHMGMVLMYSPAVIASSQYHPWVFLSSCPLVAP